jgi:hypothetical protein
MRSDLEAVKLKLRQLTSVIVAEAERNPQFAKELYHILGEVQQSARRKATATTDTGKVPDPFEAWSRLGPDDFNDWLQALSIEQLRAIVRENRFDTSRLSDKWKKREKFIELIAAAVASRSAHGDVFRHYESKPPAKD